MKKIIYILISLTILGIGYKAYADIYGSTLIGWWNLDSNTISGTTLTDVSGTGNTGTLSGTTQVHGKLGQALSFNGSSDVFTVPNDIDSGGDGTLAFWVKPADMTALRGVFEAKKTTAWFGVFIYLNYVRVQANIGGGNVIHGGTISEGRWHHIVVSTSGSAWKIYVDGKNQSITVDAGSNTGEWYDNLTSPRVTTFGNRTTGGNYFNATMDDVRLYNRQLTDAEVAQLYHQGQQLFNTF